MHHQLLQNSRSALLLAHLPRHVSSRSLGQGLRLSRLCLKVGACNKGSVGSDLPQASGWMRAGAAYGCLCVWQPRQYEQWNIPTEGDFKKNQRRQHLYNQARFYTQRFFYGRPC